MSRLICNTEAKRYLIGCS